MIEVLSREDWGADPNLPKLGYQVPVEQFRGLIVHHTVMVLNDTDHDGYSAGDLDDIGAYMRRLQTIRPDLGLDVPYSFVVFEGLTPADAVICIGRGQFRTGAHTAGYNSTAWGVALAGDYTNIAPTAGMLEAVRLIGRWLADPVNAYPTLGHRDTGYATACPGAMAYPLLDQVQPPFTSEDDMTLEDLVAAMGPTARLHGGFIEIQLVDNQWYKWGDVIRYTHLEAQRAANQGDV